MGDVREITSKDNQTFKNALKLLKRKYRSQTGEFLVEGLKFASESLTGCALKIFIKKSVKDDVLSRLDDESIVGKKVYILNDELFDKLSDTKTDQGIISVVKIPVYDIHSTLKTDEDNKAVLVLDRIQDPGNLGTIVRSAVAFGFSAILVIDGSADVFSPKVVRSSAGCVMNIPIFFSDTDEAINILKRYGYELVVTHLLGDLQSYDLDFTRSLAIVIGNEGQGASEKLVSCADIMCKIPMLSHAESLNAGVAASIIMYERIRQLK